MKTETEARKCWCPFVRREGDYVSRNPVNRPVDKDSLCIAADCMAWQRIGTLGRTKTGNRTNIYAGYCHLMGKP